MLTVQRPHPQLRAQRRLCQVDRDGAINVEPAPAKESILLHLEAYDQITGRTSARTPFAHTGHPHPRARLDAGRDPQTDAALRPHLAVPATARARIGCDFAAPQAGGTGTADRERPLPHGADAAAAAVGTLRGLGTRTRAASVACRAFLRHWHRHGNLTAAPGGPEGDLDGELDIAASFRTRCLAPFPKIEDRTE